MEPNRILGPRTPQSYNPGAVDNTYLRSHGHCRAGVLIATPTAQLHNIGQLSRINRCNAHHALSFCCRSVKTAAVDEWLIDKLDRVGCQWVTWRRRAFQLQQNDLVVSRWRSEHSCWNIERHLRSCNWPVATHVEPVDEHLTLVHSISHKVILHCYDTAVWYYAGHHQSWPFSFSNWCQEDAMQTKAASASSRLEWRGRDGHHGMGITRHMKMTTANHEYTFECMRNTKKHKYL